MRKTKSEIAPSAVQSKALNSPERITVDGHSYRLVRDPAASRAELPPFVPVVIGQTTFKLTFDVDSLADAEIALLREGHNVSLLRVLGNFNVRGVREMFGIATRFYHPEVSYLEAVSLVDLPHVLAVGAVIAKGLNPEVESGDATNTGQSESQ